MAFKRTSHLRSTRTVGGYTDIYEPPLVPDFAKTTRFTITQKYVRRPDILAYELYGDSKFWWIFPLYNRNSIVDPINDFTLNKVLLVPDRDVVAGL